VSTPTLVLRQGVRIDATPGGPACIPFARLRKLRDRFVRTGCFGRLGNSEGTTHRLSSTQRVEHTLGPGVASYRTPYLQRFFGVETLASCYTKCNAPSAFAKPTARQADSVLRRCSVNLSPLQRLPLAILRQTFWGYPPRQRRAAVLTLCKSARLSPARIRSAIPCIKVTKNLAVPFASKSGESCPSPTAFFKR
jgi:hypothetical protein